MTGPAEVSQQKGQKTFGFALQLVGFIGLRVVLDRSEQFGPETEFNLPLLEPFF